MRASIKPEKFIAIIDECDQLAERLITLMPMTGKKQFAALALSDTLNDFDRVVGLSGTLTEMSLARLFALREGNLPMFYKLQPRHADIKNMIDTQLTF